MDSEPAIPLAASMNSQHATDNSHHLPTRDEKNSLGTQLDESPEGKEDFVTGYKLILILTAFTLVQFIVMLDLAVIATAVPYITNQFNSLLDVGWYGSAYQLASASMQPLTGKLYTHFRAKWLYFFFFFLFQLGSLLCGVAQSSKMLIVARAIAGMGVSGLLNGGLTIGAACVPKHRMPAVMGLLISIGQLGQACGPLIGGVFTQDVTWRWCFYLNLPIGGLVFAMLVFMRFPERTAKPDPMTILPNLVHTLDLVGFVIIAPAAIMFFLALQYGGNQYAWNSPTVIGLFCGAAGALAAFLLWEYHKGDSAMIPFSILRKRIVWSSSIVIFFFMGVLINAAYYLPIYFQAVLGATPIMSGVYYLPNVLVHITMAMVSGVMVSKVGYYLPFALVGAALASVGYGLLSMLTPTYSTAARVGFQAITGFGLGCSVSMPYIALQTLIPEAQTSIAMAILIFCQNIGGAAFLTLAETDFSQSLRAALPRYAPAVDADAVIAAGATGFRSVVAPSELPGVLLAYSVSIDHVFYLSTGLAAGAFLAAWAMGWEDLRVYKEKAQEEPATP
ncbi:major facilitator superfamily-domain-containing protein [Xylariales sp. PMI_506]|nr:major facilitator superfamily-domain-containing protein [Xylariales sp. PMI_506]